MAEKLMFETKTCPRCGGTGHYSYCPGYGTTCFKCRGAKTVLSAAGAKARAAYEAFLLDRFGVAVPDLKVGDRIRIEGLFRTVTGVTPPDETGGYASSRGPDGVEKRVYYWTVTLNKPLKGFFCSTMWMPGADTLSELAETKYVRWSDAVWPEVLAWAAKRKGVTIVPKVEPGGVVWKEAV